MNIDPQIEQELTELAALRNMTVSAMLSEYTAKEKEYWHQRQADMEALESSKNGQSISHNEMKSHLHNLRDIAQARL